MPETWLTLEQAAVTLKCSLRTIERRIAGGKLQVRQTNDGRREALIDLPDTGAPAAQMTDAAVAAVSEHADERARIAVDAAKALTVAADRQVGLYRELSDRARDDAERAWDQIQHVRHDMELARSEIIRVRKSSRFAWATVALLSAITTAAIAFSAASITSANSDLKHMSSQIVHWRTLADTRVQDLDRADAEAQQARLAAANAEGQLHAIEKMRPTTRPTFLEALSATLSASR